ncbi:MAG: hypothetical protein ACRD5L_03585, partial [Bryobacteraceae bacterium]
MTAAEFEALKTTAPDRATALLREWSGDEHHWRTTRLENALADAQGRAKRATLDLNDTLRRLGLLRRDEAQAQLSERGRFRDHLQKQMETARAEREALAREWDALREAATAARQQTLDRLQSHNPLTTPSSPEPALTPTLAAATARAQQVARELARVEGRLTRLERQRVAMEAAWQDARDTAARVTSARQALAAERPEIRQASELADHNVAELRRKVSAARGATPLEDTIDDIVSHLMDRGRLPMSAMESVLPESGRMKARRIILNREQKIEAEREGWLRTDLPHILETEVRQLAGHLGLREALDIGRGRTFESWADVERRLNGGYERLKSAQPARSAQLEAQRQRALRDLRGLKDRLLHQVDPGADRDGGIMWLQKKVREYNFIRYGSTMLASAIPDLASFALQHRVIPMLAQHGKEAERTHLASLGIGEAEAPRLQGFMSRFGETDEHGIWDPNLSEWLGTRDGQEAARDFRIAIRRDIDRSR